MKVDTFIKIHKYLFYALIIYMIIWMYGYSVPNYFGKYNNKTCNVKYPIFLTHQHVDSSLFTRYEGSIREIYNSDGTYWGSKSENKSLLERTILKPGTELKILKEEKYKHFLLDIFGGGEAWRYPILLESRFNAISHVNSLRCLSEVKYDPLELLDQVIGGKLGQILYILETNNKNKVSIKFRVSDKTKGISPEEYKKIFLNKLSGDFEYYKSTLSNLDVLSYEQAIKDYKLNRGALDFDFTNLPMEEFLKLHFLEVNKWISYKGNRLEITSSQVKDDFLYIEGFTSGEWMARAIRKSVIRLAIEDINIIEN